MSARLHIQKTNKKKLYLTMQYGEGFYLYPSEIKRTRLQDGDMIEEEEFEKLRNEYAVPRAKKRLLHCLAKRDCTEYELRDKLKKSLNDSISIDAAMAYARDHGYIDDERFAREYLDLKKEKKSYRQIQRKLRYKGVSEDVVHTVFEEAGEQTEEDIRPLVLKYVRKFPAMDWEAKLKTYRHFSRKGYAPDVVRRLLDEMNFME